ncbi:hypothetical protein F5Y00DRAFT_274560 [Daldinia vernicosa]|uniref:uncharacterized protein n=1 Tax=Daldinia vernicosa TaxID=114800 RepID=UPI002007E5BF|nr:uncharacterized protein F5Y00DRAFT_274560 [Daldinia vernicosa]KAI0851639.1 hypothetical protein F5Y00DRAFT_274560 [Daldinia vernicosa]
MAPVTRRQAKDAGNALESEIVTPKESSRAKRKSTGNNNNLENDGAASPAQKVEEMEDPKQQGLSMRTREGESTGTDRITHPKGEIPTSPKPKSSRTSAVPDSQDKEEKSWGSDSALLSSVSKQLEEEASQRIASSQSQSQEPDQTPAPKTKGKHLVFDDDDDVENFVAAAAAAEVGKKVEADNTKNEEEDSDDDDAPEAVSTQAAAKEVQKSTQAALDAAEKQTANLKRKRQERDNLFKQQAERRKRSRAEVQVHRSKRLRKDPASNNDSDSEDDGILPDVETAVTTTGRRRAQKLAVPTHLPAEFLADSSEDEDGDEADDDDNNGQVLKKRKKTSGPQPTKITFDDQPERPRDRVVGSTKYRVLTEDSDARLAPRARRDARVSKESLLKRRRVGVVAGTGTAKGMGKKGFFVKR